MSLSPSNIGVGLGLHSLSQYVSRTYRTYFFERNKLVQVLYIQLECIESFHLNQTFWRVSWVGLWSNWPCLCGFLWWGDCQHKEWGLRLDHFHVGSRECGLHYPFLILVQRERCQFLVPNARCLFQAVELAFSLQTFEGERGSWKPSDWCILPFEIVVENGNFDVHVEQFPFALSR